MVADPQRRPAPLPEAERAETVSRLRLVIADSGTAPAEPRPPADAPPIQAPPPLRPLLRGGEIRRGSVVAIRDRRPRSIEGGAGYLALALAAAATAAGAWCGVIGMPAFGIAAASGLGADLRRFLMLDEPGDRETDAVVILAEACDIVLWNLPSRIRVPATAERRIRARIRPTEHARGAALIVRASADTWREADLHLATSDPEWTGLGDGSGHLTGRLVTVTATGRAAAGYEPNVRLWLPAADGTISAAAAEQAEDAGQPHRRLRPA